MEEAEFDDEIDEFGKGGRGRNGGGRGRNGGGRGRNGGGRGRNGGGRNRNGGGRNRKGAPPAPVDPVVGAGGDQAEAVGDPHISKTTGTKEDLCCDGGICEPCPVAFVSAN